jgi:hypothetical protein
MPQMKMKSRNEGTEILPTESTRIRPNPMQLKKKGEKNMST